MIRRANLWDSDQIFKTLSRVGPGEDFSLGLSIRDFDSESQSFIGITDLGEVFFGGPLKTSVPGFELLRAKLEVDQMISFSGSHIEPVYLLKIFAEEEDDLLAVCSIFAGLFDLQCTSPIRAALAAQAYFGYFADKEKTELIAAHEVGLFGELVVILTSNDIDTMVESWHSSPYATYDFSLGRARLEVKTSRSPQRIHWLRHSQSGVHSDPGLTYLSVYSPEASSGESVKTLVERVHNKVGNDSKRKLDSKLAAFPFNDFNCKFDYSIAAASLMRVSSKDVPFPTISDARIMDVRWKIDFSRLVADGDDDWTKFFN